MAAVKSCWFKSLTLSSLGVVLVEEELPNTDTQTVILKMIEANQDYCLAHSQDQQDEPDSQSGRQTQVSLSLFYNEDIFGIRCSPDLLEKSERVVPR